jgi:hypothetical protein
MYRREPSYEVSRPPVRPHSPAPVLPSNRPFRDTYKPLFLNAFCVCQIDTVLHYSLRTANSEQRTANSEQRTERNRSAVETARFPAHHGRPWHTQNRPEPLVEWGKSRNEKTNRAQLALNSGDLGRNRTTDTRIFNRHRRRPRSFRWDPRTFIDRLGAGISKSRMSGPSLLQENTLAFASVRRSCRRR